MPNSFGVPLFGAEAAGPSTSTPPGNRAASPGAPSSLRRPSSHGRLSKLMLPGRSRSSSTASQEVNVYADEPSPGGRTTPDQRRRTARAAASLLANDAKYKKFTGQVDRCLQSFESVNEWADFISFLSRLLKALQTPSPPYSEIPRKLIVAKRLAQCLNPALPSGVHTRALDVYAYVFSIIGVEGLKRDLLIWSSGLFPFFQFASTSVRPALIKIYETYYIPLGDNLRAAAKALILALLPGVEEETGDFFDQVLGLLTKLSTAVSSQFFLQNIFLVLVSSPASRLAALNYLGRKLVAPPEELGTSTDVGLMVRGVAAVLGDDNMLVRRNGLDLLLRILPLDGNIMREATIGDREHLVRAASAVVLQRDVSLSRRVYTWFLSPDEQPEKQIAYFKTHGLDILTHTLRTDMEKLTTAVDLSDAQAPFKVFLSLLDKWEIGGSLSGNLAIPSIKAIQSAAAIDTENEILGTAAAVYEAIEPSVLWKALYNAIDLELQEGKSEHLSLTRWLLESIPQHDEETVTIHIPIILNQVLRGVGNIGGRLLEDALQVAMSLLAAIPDVVLATASPIPDADHTSDLPVETLAFSQPVALDAASHKVRSEVAPNIVSLIFGLSQDALTLQWEPAHLLLITRLALSLIHRDVIFVSTIDGKAWTAALLSGLAKVHSFAVVDVLVDIALRASRSRTFKPPVEITSDAVMSAILDSIFRYLRLDAAPYHARAVELLWEYNQLAEIHTLESVIARRMVAGSRDRTEAFEAFGVLWRQSDDSMLPGEIFHIPMFMVLDGLKSDDPQVLRASETWMRCNLRSYFRMLDPLLRRIMDVIADTSNKVPGDLSLVHYFVSSMSSLFRFGGQGLSKACQSTEVRKSPNAMFVSQVEKIFPDTINYLDLLTDLLMKLLQEGPNRQLTLRVQSASLELLQLLVSRGDLPSRSLSMIKTTLVEKLALSTQRRMLTLQNAMLHLLHSALSATTVDKRARTHRITASISEKVDSEPPVDFEQSLIQTVIIGISSPGNRPILQHWVDFVLMTVVHLENRPVQLRLLCDCFCEQLRMTMLLLRNTFSVISVSDTPAIVTEAEPIMLLGVVERLTSVLGGKTGIRRSEDGVRPNNEGGSGILGYLPTVFSVEAPQDIASKNEAARYLDDVMDSLLVTWTVTMDSDDRIPSSAAASKLQIMSRTRMRARKALEKMFKSQPSEVIGSCIQVWAVKSSDISDAAIFDCIDVLAPSAQKVVDLICEHMSGKGRGSVTDSSNPALAAFLETYISRLEGPIAVQVWNTLYSYARDVLNTSSTPSTRSQLFPVLRCLTILGKIVSTTSALEDRRLRRDLQDTYVKVLDLVLSSASRLGDSVTWDRGGDNEAFDDDKAAGDARGVQKIYSFVGEVVLQNLRTFLVENDRVSAACANVSTHVVVPAIKQQKVDATILNILREMTKIPVAVKAWRLHIGDAFNDTKFFRMHPDESIAWKPLVRALMDSDKERLGDLLGRIAAAPSANIFTNREQEMIVRSLNLRRLSFVLLAGERNHYLTHLPSIQEKLVEILRTNVVSPRVHSEVYLCLRVLMCRISPQHLANFWPVIQAELLRVFEATMDDPPADGSEDLVLILAACKFLDLLLVIQSEDFQIHQWIFVTDTTDAVFPPEDYNPEAIMDRLAEIVLEHGPKTIEEPLDIEVVGSAALRRPRLASVKALSSLHQLRPFFARASIDTFEGVYSDAGIDWEAIEDALIAEIFEGRE